MSKDDMIIMVVERKLLFCNDCFEGFKQQKETDYESRILKNFKYMRRGNVEDNPDYKQPICYCMIVNPNLKKVFVYQRASHDKKYDEKRLMGKYSLGIGGHIEKIDTNNGNPLHSSMLREIDEEVEINGEKNPKVIGYINNESDNVNMVHFGILYVIETDSDAVNPKDPEIENGKLMALNEAEKLFSSKDIVVEEWSKISFNALKSYFKQQNSTHLI